jgi:hypothetical protein
MVDALYEELNSRQQKIFEDHLSSCETCSAEYQQLSWTLKVMDRRETPVEQPGYWQKYWARLSERLPEKTPTLLRGPGPGVPVQATVFDPSLIAEFNELASSYLERTKMVLMGLNNFDPRMDDPAALNVSRHRDLSQELLLQGRMLRNHQVTAADPRMQILIDEIERVLLQVANSSGEDPMWTVRMAQEGIDKNSILLRITLVEIEQTEMPADEGEPQVKTSSFLT